MAGLDFPWPVARMILERHERVDGSGYPAGLKGEAILVGSRIVAVADVLEAMSAHRPYRAACSLAAAADAVGRGWGTRSTATSSTPLWRPSPTTLPRCCAAVCLPPPVST